MQNLQCQSGTVDDIYVEISPSPWCMSNSTADTLSYQKAFDYVNMFQHTNNIYINIWFTINKYYITQCVNMNKQVADLQILPNLKASTYFKSFIVKSALPFHQSIN